MAHNYMSQEALPQAIRTRSAQATVCGVETNMLVTAYSNRFFVHISQNENFGTLIHSWRDNPVEGACSSFSTRVLLGRRDDETLEVYARTLIELISQRSSLPLLLSISMKEHSPEMFKGILRELDQIRLW
mmetsp:Transcript_57483/g.132008  ORF Transcript_57483/g.132008 Transcript_57483/m.132008 type:complete len:130 (-) Transcript_57483:401-790(-)